MKTEQAFGIVYELAEQNALDHDTVDDDMMEEADRQQTALRIVSEYLREHGLTND